MRKNAIILAIALMIMSLAAMAQDQATEAADSQSPVDQEPESQQAGEEGRSVRRLGDMVGGGESEFSMDFPTIDMPEPEAVPQPEVSLPTAEQDEALQALLLRRAFNPEDPDIETELSALMDQVEADAQAAVEDGNFALAQQLTGVIAEFEPDRTIIDQVAGEINRRSDLATALANADAALAAGNLLSPENTSATAYYRQALSLDPTNAAAQAGLQSIFAALLERALTEAQSLDFETAESTLNQALTVVEDEAAVEDARIGITEFRDQYLQDLDAEALSAMNEGNYEESEGAITRLLALGYPRQRVDALQALLNDARLYGSLEPGQILADDIPAMGGQGPDMVVIPTGSFLMGSDEDEANRFSNEGPRHRVTFNRGFALSRSEVTVRDFAAFVNATGYRTDAEREGSSRIYDPRTGRMDSRNGVTWRDDFAGDDADPDLPVIHVSWNDARAYVNWLARESGRSYRLPSEAEFEYALRAGTQTPYWWGDDAPEDNTENVTGDGDISPTSARWNVAFDRYTDDFWGPAPVASLRPNPFGLYDMSGNVMEWVDDCWHDSFVRAPDDGSSWMNPGCGRHVIKGAAWSSTPAMSRSAFRLSSAAESTDMRVGFRVARDL